MISGMAEKSFKAETLSIPKSHVVVEILGEGSYGVTFKCYKEETNEFVAVKTSKKPDRNALLHEAEMMKTVMSENLDQANIVKFNGELYSNNKLSLEFELLDISLKKYISTHTSPRLLSEIRTIVQQLAVALDGLKRVGVIHGDLKLDNIMVVDKFQEPLRVKLIDFGLAIFSSEAGRGRLLQPHQLRAPEILFGLDFSEAIDIWSLGCIMVFVVFGVFIFRGSNEYESLKNIIDLLGPPPKHLLDGGVRTKRFFKKQKDSWTLKTLGEYWEDAKLRIVQKPPCQSDTLDFTSLDNMKKLRQGVDDDLDDLRECADLLQSMLQWDAQERITPDGILNHPFVTRSSASSSHVDSEDLAPKEEETKKTTKDKKPNFFSRLTKTFACMDVD